MMGVVVLQRLCDSVNETRGGVVLSVVSVSINYVFEPLAQDCGNGGAERSCVLKD